MSGNGKACIILAAGKGTRMRSAVPKVLHPIAGRTMLAHVLEAARAARVGRPVVVIGPDMDDVADEARAVWPDCRIVLQAEQLGTADAVKAAKSELEGFTGQVLVLFADTPLISPETLNTMFDTLESGAGLVVLGFRPDDPAGYGRLIVDDNGALTAIREQLDASASERLVDLCNSGVMGFDGARLFDLIDKIGNDNAKGEYYLTDAVELARAEGLAIEIAECGHDEVRGINSRNQLAAAEAVFQTRARAAAMAQGVTMQAPETVTLSADTRFGTDVTIEPNVIFGPGVTVGTGVTIKGFSHIEGASIADGATIGPFARLRAGAEIGPGARIGNFVEVKNAVLEAGAKANHLSYLGDAHVGAGANVGAGTITCNYDGYGKHRTEIGAGAFIGSNSALVAPVVIGDGAYVASGSVITEDVASDALAIGRGRQVQKDKWAKRLRDEHARPAEKPRAKARQTS